MIKINKTPTADSRSSKGPIPIDALQKGTADHIGHVENGLNFFAKMLKEAGKDHDHTKTDNIDDFAQALNSGKIKQTKWYKKHITEERHHLLSNAPDDVNLIDVLEHLTDCVMAGTARSGKVYDTELPTDLLQAAVNNTVKLLQANIEVVGEEK